MTTWAAPAGSRGRPAIEHDRWRGPEQTWSLLLAAVEAYRLDLAARVRQHLGPAGASTKADTSPVIASLGLRGGLYRLAVQQVGPRRYAAAQPGTSSMDVTVDAVDDRRRLLTVGEESISVEVISTPTSLVITGDLGRQEVTWLRDVHARSPFPAVVVRELVDLHDRVTAGSPLLALESMKMEVLVRAPEDGTVTGLPFRVGDQVAAGEVVVGMQPTSTSARVELGQVVAPVGCSGLPSTEPSDVLRGFLLGFDIDDAELHSALARYTAQGPLDHDGDLQLLEAYANLRDVVGGGAAATTHGEPRERAIAGRESFARMVQGGAIPAAGPSDHYLEALRAALHRYEAKLSSPGARLEECLFRLLVA